MSAISSGKINTATKYVIYGVEGVGKTTLAMAFPKPLFSDMEGGTYRYDCLRFSPHIDINTRKKIFSWALLRAEVNYVQANTEICKTYVIDTIDAAINCLVTEFCDSKKIKGIEDIGYGKGWVYIQEEVGRLLNDLQDLVDKGINVVLLSHAAASQFDDPTTLSSYSRYGLKINTKSAAIIKEWADTLLFLNYDVQTVTTGQGFAQKTKGQGQKRMIYTSHTAAFDAKNRDGLPEKIEFTSGADAVKILLAAEAPKPDDDIPFTLDVPADGSVPVETLIPKKAEQQPLRTEPDPLDALPGAVAELAKMAGVTAEDIRKAVASRGYFPEDMPVTDYPADFVDGVLVGAWQQVLAIIQK